MKHFVKYISAGLLVLLLCNIYSSVMAEETMAETTVVVMKTANQADIKETADNNSKTILQLDKDTPILIIKQTNADWYEVKYQNTQGYMGKKNVNPYADGEQLQHEFSDMEEYFQNGFTLVQKYQKVKQQNTIWKIVISLMIGGICALAVYTKIKKRRLTGNDKECAADVGEVEKPIS